MDLAYVYMYIYIYIYISISVLNTQNISTPLTHSGIQEHPSVIQRDARRQTARSLNVSIISNGHTMKKDDRVIGSIQFDESSARSFARLDDRRTSAPRGSLGKRITSATRRRRKTKRRRLKEVGRGKREGGERTWATYEDREG